MNEQVKIKVLFLPRWYPDRYDPMPGLFIRRQAEAVSSFCDVSVLYVHEDPQCKVNFEIADTQEENIRVVRVYYGFFKPGPEFVRNAVRLYRFLKAYWLGFRILRPFYPDLLHVHVLTRSGLIALGYKLLMGIPYVITEHWSRYFLQNDSYKGLLRKCSTRLVIHFAAAVVAVSGKLKQAMLDKKLGNPDFRVIPNPVDMEKFSIAGIDKEIKNSRKIIIHVSCFEDRSKNISGFLKVISQLSEKRNDFECRLIGDGPDMKEVVRMARDLGLMDKVVFFTGLKEQDDLVDSVREADFMVLSSHFETFASVVVESLACGIPVVATDVGVVRDVVDESNGMIIPPGNEQEMLKAVDRMIDRCREYDKAKVRESVEARYQNKIIGEQLFNMYLDILARNHRTDHNT